MKTKRVLLAGDLHSGHFSGLVSPPWWPRRGGSRDSLYRLQSTLWRWYEREINKLKPFDIAVWNGDLIDGRGEKSGGTELITTDIEEQCAIALSCIKYVEAENNLITRGTPYHVSHGGQDWENYIAESIGAKIGGHEWLDVNGVIFDAKHKIGSSQIPHGRHTAIARERLWNVLWSEMEGAPRADIVVRSHVHYFSYCGGHDFLAITLPALQGIGSKYGVMQCSGLVHFGFVVFDVDETGGYTWQEHIMPVKALAPTAMKF